MKAKILFALASLLLTGGLFALEPGELAPATPTSKFLAGDAFKLSDVKGKGPCVIEFFASWDDSGLDGIKTLARLKREFAKDNLSVLAISSEKEKDVAPLVAKLGKSAGACPIALDDNGASEAAYMSSEPAYPAYFLVDKNGVLVWKGQGADLSAVLKKHLAGKFTAEDFKKVSTLRKQIADSISQKSLNKAIDASEELLKIMPSDFDTVKLRLALYNMQRNTRQAIDFLNRQIEAAPDADALYFAKLDLMLRSDPKASAEEVAKFADASFKAFDSNPEALNNLAWILVDETEFGNAPLALALKGSQRSVELLRKDDDKELLAASLDTLARLYHEAGRNDKAIELQSEALEFWKGSDDEERAKHILDYYKAAQGLAPSNT